MIVIHLRTVTRGIPARTINNEQTGSPVSAGQSVTNAEPVEVAADNLIERQETETVGHNAQINEENRSNVSEAVVQSGSSNKVESGVNIGSKKSEGEVTVGKEKESEVLVENRSGEVGTPTESDSNESTEIVEDEVEILTASELRQRRINFLSGKPSACEKLENNTQIECDTKKSDKSVPLGSDKASVVDHQNLPENQNQESSSQSVQVESQTSSSSSVPAEPEQRSEEAPGRTSDSSSRTVPDEIRVKIKFLNETVRMVTSPATETIGNFRRSVYMYYYTTRKRTKQKQRFVSLK